VKHVALFAPPNCTENSGAIGDTVLQTSLVQTLLDRRLFPELETVHWWGAHWVINQLFPDLSPRVQAYAWNGAVDTMPTAETVLRQNVSVAFICTRNESATSAIRAALPTVPCYTPKMPLNAQSSIHLCRQLHTCLQDLGLSIPAVPRPRIVVTDDDLEAAKRDLTIQNLKQRNVSTERTAGKESFNVAYDKLFLISPSLGQHQEDDRRTWLLGTWRRLAYLLGNVGPVIVAYNPGDRFERRGAEEAVLGELSFWPRFAIGLTLRDIAVLACASTVCVARDSGPMHVAAAAASPAGPASVIGLVSVFNPETWRPLSNGFEGMGQWPLPLEDCVRPEEVAVRAASIDKRTFGV
jgi:ADP-heptose:LPS heptosyltransferase